MEENMNNIDRDDLANGLSGTMAGLALIQRAFRDTTKTLLEKKKVVIVSIDQMEKRGDPAINMLIVPLLKMFVLGILSEEPVKKLVDDLIDVDPSIKETTERANRYLDKRDALVKLYKEGGIRIEE